MVEFLKSNWPLLVTGGGVIVTFLNVVKTIFEIMHLRKQIELAERKLHNETESPEKKLEEMIQITETQVKTVTKNLVRTTLIIALIVSASLFSFHEKQYVEKQNIEIKDRLADTMLQLKTVSNYEPDSLQIKIFQEKQLALEREKIESKVLIEEIANLYANYDNELGNRKEEYGNEIDEFRNRYNTKIAMLKTKHNNTYDDYVDAYNQNRFLLSEKDSLDSRLTSITFANKSLQDINHILEESIDSLNTGIARLSRTLERMEEENLGLRQKRDTLRLDFNEFPEIRRRVIATVDYYDLERLQDRISQIELSQYRRASHISLAYSRETLDLELVTPQHFSILSFADHLVLKASSIQNNFEGIDSTKIIKTIRKGEDELIELVELDIELIKRFNQRFQRQIDMLETEIQQNLESLQKRFKDYKIELENEYKNQTTTINTIIRSLERMMNQLTKENKALSDTIRQLTRKTKFWTAKYGSTQNSFQTNLRSAQELADRYEELVREYHKKSGQQFVLLEEIRELRRNRIEN